MTSAMSEYLFSFEAKKVEKNMAVQGKGQKPKNEVKSKKYQTFRGDMLQLKESRAILLHQHAQKRAQKGPAIVEEK